MRAVEELAADLWLRGLGDRIKILGLWRREILEEALDRVEAIAGGYYSEKYLRLTVLGEDKDFVRDELNLIQ